MVSTNSLLVQLEITLADGSTQIVTSDDSWKCAAGPIISSDFMMGEAYDARQELFGWDQPDYNDTEWANVRRVPAPDVPLVAQRSEPVQIIEMVTPLSVHESAPGTWIYDLGQNITGVAPIES